MEHMTYGEEGTSDQSLATSSAEILASDHGAAVNETEQHPLSLTAKHSNTRGSTSMDDAIGIEALQSCDTLALESSDNGNKSLGKGESVDEFPETLSRSNIDETIDPNAEKVIIGEIDGGNYLSSNEPEKKTEEEFQVPEYDEQLNHVFFAKKSLDYEARIKSEELRLKFFSTYKAFFENRQDMINSLRDIADQVIRVQHSCNISHIVGGSIGVFAGATALIGTVAFPPLLLGGLAVAGAASLSNLGTSIIQFFAFRNLIETAAQKSKYDLGLMKNLEEAYEILIASNLFSIKGHSNEELRKGFSSAKLHLGLDGAKGGTLAVGIQSLSAGMVEVGSGLLKGAARGALGIGVLIDGVTIYISADDISKGSNTKLSDALRKVADEKETELENVKKKVKASGLFDAGGNADSGDSPLVLSRYSMASVL